MVVVLAAVVLVQLVKIQLPLAQKPVTVVLEFLQILLVLR
jgi:hypothetical protein